MKAPKIGGYIPIPSEADRLEIGKLLLKHGYTVSTNSRYKRDGKSFVYCVKYELKPQDIKEEDLVDEI